MYKHVLVYFNHANNLELIIRAFQSNFNQQ